MASRAGGDDGAGRFELPRETAVGAVRILVSDLDRSIEFYDRVIGLRAIGRAGETAVLAPHGDQRPVVRLETRPGVNRARRGANGLYHFAIRLPQRVDLGRYLVHLDSAGVAFGAADHLVSEALYLSDPDGLGIEIYVDRPRDSWREANGELVMATDPLDVNSLAALAEGRAWSGAPRGTVVGHVHLHVGDLDEARRFYTALGFNVTVQGYPGALFFAAGDYHHHLGTNTWGSGAAAEDGEARLLEWELLAPNAAEAAAASVLAAGYRAERAGAAWSATDPWGTRVVLRD